MICPECTNGNNDGAAICGTCGYLFADSLRSQVMMPREAIQLRPRQDPVDDPEVTYDLTARRVTDQAPGKASSLRQLIPKESSTKLVHKEWFVEAIGAGGTVVSSIAASVLAIPVLLDYAIKSYTELGIAGAAVSGAAVGVAHVLAKVVRGAYNDSKEKDSNNLDGLRSSLYMLRSVALATRRGTNVSDGGLRVTIHLREEFQRDGVDHEQLVQLFNYVGGGGGGKGRIFSANAGVTGLAVQLGGVFFFNRDSVDYEAFLEEMVKKYHFTLKQARRLSMDRNAWMAVPIKHDGEVTGVVYLDSNERDFFTHEMRKAILGVCYGIAEFIDMRWNK